jgi:hypothetical protein
MIKASEENDDCDEDETDLMIIASHKRMTIEDWRPEMNYCKALCSNRLRKSDYSVFNSVLIAQILVILMGLCICIA